MTLRLAAEGLQQVVHIQLIGSECSEGIILVDLGQSITWANPAALSMHKVTEVVELGQTIDEYHARFQVKYVAVLAETARSTRTILGEERGRTQPEVLMEFRPQSEAAQTALHRTRKIVLLDGAGRPSCIVFLIHQISTPAAADKFSDLLSVFPNPAVILRPEDRSVVAANAAFIERSENAEEFPTAIDLAGKGWETDVEVDGQHYVLLDFGRATPNAKAAQPVLPAHELAADLAVRHSVPTHTIDENLCIVEVNQPWLDWLGYSRDMVIGRRISDFMVASSAEHFGRSMQDRLNSAGKMVASPADFVAAAGGTVNALVSAMPVCAGERKLLAAVCVDVTAHKRSEDAVASMFAHAPVPMLIRNHDNSKIISANEAFLKTTGYDVSDVVGHNFDEFGLFESKTCKDAFEASLRTGGRAEAADFNLKAAHGESLDCALTAAQLSVFGKTCVLLFLQDVSERRRTEVELMAALDAVMNDGSWFGRSVVERLAAHRAPPKSGRRAAALGDLTPREKDVLSLISLGLPDAEIAERLGLTRSTIRNHLSTLYSKINVKNRGSAIIWARERCINITQLPLRPKSLQPKFGHSGTASKQVVALNQGGRMHNTAKSAIAE